MESKNTFPPINAFLSFRIPKIIRNITDLPDPDSPTTAIFSPLNTFKLMLFNTFKFLLYNSKDSSNDSIDNKLFIYLKSKSKASLSPSPRRLKPTTKNKIAKPGNNDSQ